MVIDIANRVYKKDKNSNSSKLPSPLMSYKFYTKSNLDADRDTVTDLTGNGFDFQLHNFTYDTTNGYVPKYYHTFDDINMLDTKRSDCKIIDKYTIEVNNTYVESNFIRAPYALQPESLKVRIEGINDLPSGSNLVFTDHKNFFYFDKGDGEYTITDGFGNFNGFRIQGDLLVNHKITITIIPNEYAGCIFNNSTDYSIYAATTKQHSFDYNVGYTILLLGVQTKGECSIISKNTSFTWCLLGNSNPIVIYSFGGRSQINLYNNKEFKVYKGTDIQFERHKIINGGIYDSPNIPIRILSYRDPQNMSAYIASLMIFNERLSDKQMDIYSAEMQKEYDEYLKTK